MSQKLLRRYQAAKETLYKTTDCALQLSIVFVCMPNPVPAETLSKRRSKPPKKKKKRSSQERISTRPHRGSNRLYGASICLDSDHDDDDDEAI